MAGTIKHSLNAVHRLVEMTVAGDISDRAALQKISEIWTQHPEVIGYDWLVDVTEDWGGVSWGGISRIAERWYEFADKRETALRTALIVRNEQWARYTEAIATLFPTREFRAFATRAEALKWLGRANGI